MNNSIAINKSNIAIIVLITILITGLLYLKILSPQKEQIHNFAGSLQKKAAEDRSVYIGFWTQGLWDKDLQSINPAKLKELEAKIDKKVAIANYFHGWQYLTTDLLINDFNILNHNGWRPMISANPYFFDECPANGMTLYKAIASGNCDKFMHKIAINLAKVKNPFYLRFAWEMNVDTIEWSNIYNKSTPEEFKAAWQRFHDILKKQKVNNVIWVFSPQVETPTTTKIKDLYPGDNYVDWVALDGYNWGTSKSWSSWQNFYSLYNYSYQEMLMIAPKKPFMIAEVNTTDAGGNQAQWYNDMLSIQIPNFFPKIKAIVFFNENKIETEGVKWLIDNTPDSLYEFKTSLKNPIYKSNFVN